MRTRSARRNTELAVGWKAGPVKGPRRKTIGWPDNIDAGGASGIVMRTCSVVVRTDHRAFTRAK